MEKTPRRLAPSGNAPSGNAPSGNAHSGSAPQPAGSVVVDPTAQALSSGPSSSRSGRGPASSGRRKPEATLVLEARRVDTLRRQVVERQRAEQKGRRRQMVLWGLAGAGAVLLGGWLATRLSPKDADQGEASLVLGRSEEDRAMPPEPAQADEESQVAAPDEPARDRRRGTSSARAVAPAGGEPEVAGVPDAEAPPPEASAPEAGVQRDPDEPKVVGDWGDGFEGASHREGSSRSAAVRPAPAGPAPAGSQAVNLDELPTE